MVGPARAGGHVEGFPQQPAQQACEAQDLDSAAAAFFPIPEERRGAEAFIQGVDEGDEGDPHQGEEDRGPGQRGQRASRHRCRQGGPPAGPAGASRRRSPAIRRVSRKSEASMMAGTTVAKPLLYPAQRAAGSAGRPW